MFVGHVGIDLRRADVGVTEKRLDTAEISAVGEEIRGKDVS